MKCDLSKITCIEDLRLVAKRKMPRMFYDYIDSGSWTETTYRETLRISKTSVSAKRYWLIWRDAVLKPNDWAGCKNAGSDCADRFYGHGAC